MDNVRTKSSPLKCILLEYFFLIHEEIVLVVTCLCSMWGWQGQARVEQCSGGHRPVLGQAGDAGLR